ncbi:hypothetical protein M2167_000665 [Streptomyces sp. SPB4]|nr:hypothetical protein [Streptomyces sp. SPB4]
MVGGGGAPPPPGAPPGGGPAPPPPPPARGGGGGPPPPPHHTGYVVSLTRRQTARPMAMSLASLALTTAPVLLVDLRSRPSSQEAKLVSAKFTAM